MWETAATSPSLIVFGVRGTRVWIEIVMVVQFVRVGLVWQTRWWHRGLSMGLFGGSRGHAEVEGLVWVCTGLAVGTVMLVGGAVGLEDVVLVEVWVRSC